MNSAATSKPTVYVLDDHLQERESIAALVSTIDCESVGFATSEEFFALSENRRPGCLILDYRLGQEDGMDVLERLRTQANPLPTIVVTAFADVPTAVQFINRGAMTLLEKPFREGELLECVQQAIQKDRESMKVRQRMSRMADRVASLTERQRKIVDLVLQGHLNKKIASLLGVSQRTIENERATILNLLEANNAVELAAKITEFRGYQEFHGYQSTVQPPTTSAANEEHSNVASQ